MKNSWYFIKTKFVNVGFALIVLFGLGGVAYGINESHLLGQEVHHSVVVSNRHHATTAKAQNVAAAKDKIEIEQQQQELKDQQEQIFYLTIISKGEQILEGNHADTSAQIAALQTAQNQIVTLQKEFLAAEPAIIAGQNTLITELDAICTQIQANCS